MSIKKIVIIGLSLASFNLVYAGPSCKVNENKIPMWKVAQNFEENEKGTIKVLKETSGKCYEIYGFKNGEKVEIYYDPNNGKSIS